MLCQSYRTLLRSVQTMQLCSLGQGKVSPSSIVPRCPRVLQVLPTMSNSSQVSQLSQSQLSDIIGSTCNTLGQRGTMLHGDTIPRSKVAYAVAVRGAPRACHCQCLKERRNIRKSVTASIHPPEWSRDSVKKFDIKSLQSKLHNFKVQCSIL